MEKIEVLIVGAGPSGLAIAGELAKKNIPYLIIEKSGEIANSWRQHYDRLCLHTVKEYSDLPNYPFPLSYPRYVPRDLLVEYYESYADTHGIKPRFHCKLKSITKKGNNWEVSLDDGSILICRAVVIATGINRNPIIPTWEGQHSFNGRIIHSREYINPKEFRGKATLIVGMGNTGAEIALDLCEQGVETYLSVRNEVLIVPRDVLGNPAQVTARKLEKLPFGLGDHLGNITRKLVIGSLSKYGIKVNPRPAIIHLRETGATPVIDLGTVKKIKEGEIKVTQEIKSFVPEGVILVTGEEVQVDEVILATGYEAALSEFIQLDLEYFDKKELPKTCISEGAWKGLYFIGFDNYQLGGILGAIHRDSTLVSNAIEKQLSK